jgi:hypothetical protein
MKGQSTMKERDFHYRMELSPEINVMRVYRWIRTLGKSPKPKNRMQRVIGARRRLQRLSGRGRR